MALRRPTLVGAGMVAATRPPARHGRAYKGRGRSRSDGGRKTCIDGQWIKWWGWGGRWRPQVQVWVLLVHDPGFGVCGASAGDGAIVLGLGGPARARRRKRVLQGWRALPPFAVRSVVVTTFHRIDWR